MDTETDSTEYEHTQVQFRRLLGRTEALESLIALLVSRHPDRQSIITAFEQNGRVFDDVALAEDFSDEELEDITEARRRVLAVLHSYSGQK